MTKKLAFPGVKAYETQGSGLREGPEQSPHYTNGLCGKASAKTATLENLQKPLSLSHTHTRIPKSFVNGSNLPTSQARRQIRSIDDIILHSSFFAL